MNGQPPPPHPPPSSIPPSSVPPIQPAQPYYPPPRSGMGCFAKGCLTVLVLGFFLGAAVIGCGWFFYKKTFTKLTSTAPSDIRIEAPTPEQLKTAQTSRDRLNE